MSLYANRVPFPPPVAPPLSSAPAQHVHSQTMNELGVETGAQMSIVILRCGRVNHQPANSFVISVAVILEPFVESVNVVFPKIDNANFGKRL